MPRLGTGVERPVHRVVLGDPGIVLQHDHIDEPPGRGGHEQLRPARVVGREADEPRLARPADRVGDRLELRAPGPGRLDVEVLVAQGVDQDRVDIVGLELLEPLVQQPDELLGRAHHGLRDQEQLLAGHGRRLHPPRDHRLGTVALGRVDIADAVGPGEAQEPLAARAHPGAEGEHGHVDPRPAQPASGQRGRLLLVRAVAALGRIRAARCLLADDLRTDDGPASPRVTAAADAPARGHHLVIPERRRRGERAGALPQEIPTIHPAGPVCRFVTHLAPSPLCHDRMMRRQKCMRRV